MSTETSAATSGSGPRFEVDPRLTFLASYPKSGNTWVRLLIGTYLHRHPNQRIEFDDIQQMIYQSVCPVPVTELKFAQAAQVRPAAMFFIARMARGRPTLVKTHNASGSQGGIPLFAPAWTERVIHVIRDPRDVCCSLAPHLGISLEDAAAFMARSDAELADQVKVPHLLGSWSDHAGSWRRVDGFPVLHVRYEDLHEDTEGELARIMEFLGEDEIDDQRIEVAVEANQFDRLKEREEEVGFQEVSEKADRFFRRGEAGGWRDELDAELVEKLEADHADEMAEYGYEPSLVGA